MLSRRATNGNANIPPQLPMNLSNPQKEFNLTRYINTNCKTLCIFILGLVCGVVLTATITSNLSMTILSRGYVLGKPGQISSSYATNTTQSDSLSNVFSQTPSSKRDKVTSKRSKKKETVKSAKREVSTKDKKKTTAKKKPKKRLRVPKSKLTTSTSTTTTSTTTTKSPKKTTSTIITTSTTSTTTTSERKKKKKTAKKPAKKPTKKPTKNATKKPAKKPKTKTTKKKKTKSKAKAKSVSKSKSGVKIVLPATKQRILGDGCFSAWEHIYASQNVFVFVSDDASSNVQAVRRPKKFSGKEYKIDPLSFSVAAKKFVRFISPDDYTKWPVQSTQTSIKGMFNFHTSNKIDVKKDSIPDDSKDTGLTIIINPDQYTHRYDNIMEHVLALWTLQQEFYPKNEVTRIIMWRGFNKGNEIYCRGESDVNIQLFKLIWPKGKVYCTKQWEKLTEDKIFYIRRAISTDRLCVLSHLKNEEYKWNSMLQFHMKTIRPKFPSLRLRVWKAVKAKGKKKLATPAKFIFIRRNHHHHLKKASRKHLFRVLRNNSDFLLRREKFDGKVITKQIQIAAQTDIMMGSHGPGLAHALWMKPKGLLVEITPPSFFSPNMMVLGYIAGLRHFSWHCANGFNHGTMKFGCPSEYFRISGSTGAYYLNNATGLVKTVDGMYRLMLKGKDPRKVYDPKCVKPFKRSPKLCQKLEVL